jgi:uncharacterized protein RhaS with RHS repeats
VATLTYDSDGEMTGADDSNATETFTYDDGGNLETEVTSGPGTGQPTLTLTYSYDSSGDIATLKDSLSGSGATGQGIATYVYDNTIRLTTITQSIGGTAGPKLCDGDSPRRTIGVSSFFRQGIAVQGGLRGVRAGSLFSG